MAIYASSETRGTQRVDLVTLGTISAPLQSLANDQLFVAQGVRRKGAGRPARARAQPMAVQSSTSVPSGQRT
ncbi:hypothetical protein ABIC83_003400 [Roseateles asaccharophilus]|uniref:Uncharacterized protein n=1 Tax=Roseateles asaccharophilus TaxID=582607 RepID=A0ABU2AFN6_9BURK|nr:hypothetical protein [Roseateles asaccharophilus]